jgi:hypothetical protein
MSSQDREDPSITTPTHTANLGANEEPLYLLVIDFVRIKHNVRQMRF